MTTLYAKPAGIREDKVGKVGGRGEERYHGSIMPEHSKALIEKGVTGKVKWYSVRYHYGFIARDEDRANDVFVHQTAIAKSRIIKTYLRTLGDGEEVVFDIVEGKQGPEAANVSGPDGAPVRGSRFAVLFRRSSNRYKRPRDSPFDSPPRRETRPNSRRISIRDDIKDLKEGTDALEAKESGTGRRRRVRNFRGRRAVKKEFEEEGKEACGDFLSDVIKAKTDPQMVDEGSGDRHNNRRLPGRRGQRRRAGTESDAIDGEGEKAEGKDSKQTDDNQKEMIDKTNKDDGGDSKLIEDVTK